MLVGAEDGVLCGRIALDAPVTMFASSHAAVINISSIYGIVGSRGPLAGYNVTKGALINATRHLAAH